MLCDHWLELVHTFEKFGSLIASVRVVEEEATSLIVRAKRALVNQLSLNGKVYKATLGSVLLHGCHTLASLMTVFGFFLALSIDVLETFLASGGNMG